MKYIFFFIFCISSALISSNSGSASQKKVMNPHVLQILAWKAQLLTLQSQIQSQSADIKKLLKKSADLKKQKAELALQASLAQKISNKDRRAFAIAKIKDAQTALSLDEIEIGTQLADLHNLIAMEKEELLKIKNELADASLTENKVQPLQTMRVL